MVALIRLIAPLMTTTIANWAMISRKTLPWANDRRRSLVWTVNATPALTSSPANIHRKACERNAAASRASGLTPRADGDVVPTGDPRVPGDGPVGDVPVGDLVGELVLTHRSAPSRVLNLTTSGRRRAGPSARPAGSLSHRGRRPISVCSLTWAIIDPAYGQNGVVRIILTSVESGPRMICLISASSTTFIPISGSTTAPQRVEDRELGRAPGGVERGVRRRLGRGRGGLGGGFGRAVGHAVLRVCRTSVPSTRGNARKPSGPGQATDAPDLMTTPGIRYCAGRPAASASV